MGFCVLHESRTPHTQCTLASFQSNNIESKLAIQGIFTPADEPLLDKTVAVLFQTNVTKRNSQNA